LGERTGERGDPYFFGKGIIRHFFTNFFAFIQKIPKIHVDRTRKRYYNRDKQDPSPPKI